MTDNKLTLQDCFKYPEAEIRHIGGSFKDVFELIIRSYDANMSTLYMLADYNCKLILRDISELTDKEIKKCHDIALWDGDGVPIDERRILIDEKLKFWDCSLSKAERDLADYLKEINVDIYGFLKCGKAVKND